MKLNKRDFLVGSGLVAGLATLSATATAQEASTSSILPSVAAAKPIGRDEHLARLAKVQGIMRDKNVRMLVIEPGAAMTYFTGLRWWRSERPIIALIPADGEVGMVAPAFEAPSIEETMAVPFSIRTWEENEDPFAVVKTYADDWKVGRGQIGIDETVRFFIADGIRNAVKRAKTIPGAPIIRACRMIKSPAELALMQAATDVTIAAYADVGRAVVPGMSADEIKSLMNARTRAYGGTPQFSIALPNEASAYPHGTDKVDPIGEGSILLMDCGCSVHGYKSDVSRTWVIGEPTKRQKEVWATVKRGQELAMEVAVVGNEAGLVDRTVRQYYESQGWGPRYATPGLSHRLGHGIGMEGHEPINLVENETTKLQPGMCFSNEPGLYSFGEFGVRLEDCFTVTEDGPKLFSGFQKSISSPA
ncbi:MAG: aminopeptidase P family protein [Parvularculaceae bacterium]|nr:aminopeptidase P family protein [Parvularculaceae bacterium]